MLNALPLALVFVLAVASPAAAGLFDFSWTSSTFFTVNDPATGSVVGGGGGTISGRDPLATWDPNTGTLRWVFDGQVFGGQFFRDEPHDIWAQNIEIPTDPSSLAHRNGGNAFIMAGLRETDTGFTLVGGFFGGLGCCGFERFSFSGTGINTGSVTAPEPAGLLLTAVGLAGALRLRRQRRSRQGHS